MTDNQRVLAYLREHQGDMVADLTRLVEMESPSDDKAGLDRLGEHLADVLRELDAQVDVIGQERTGNHLRARWGAGERGGLLLLCHMDTVWDLGTVAKRPVRIEDGRLYGPGAFDMKGGIVNVLWAVRALRALGLVPAARHHAADHVGRGGGQPDVPLDHRSRGAAARRGVRARARAPAARRTQDLAQGRRPVQGARDRRLRARRRSARGRRQRDRGDWRTRSWRSRQLTDYAAGTTVNVGVIGGGTREQRGTRDMPGPGSMPG